MKSRIIFTLLLAGLCRCTQAQTPADTAKPVSGVLIVPFQDMMHFSDADADMARMSQMNERQVRAEISNRLELNVYHQLLSTFNAISLKRATSLNGEEDLRRIYAATRYTLFARSYEKNKTGSMDDLKDAEADALVKSWNKNGKDKQFRVTDSAVMLGNIESGELFQFLQKKHQAKYLLFLTQFEIETSHKNTIEWTLQRYTRTYSLHYNLYNMNGRLIRAETLILQGDGENKVEQINQKFMMQFALRLKDILVEVDR